MQQSNLGQMIRTFRLEHSLTQKQLADKMNLSDKTISKWERGIGLPEISLLPALSDLLGIDAQNLLAGNLSPNDFVSGNMKQTKYYICPTCHNITLCTGAAEVSCCGKKLSHAPLKKAKENETLSVHVIENEWFITSDHPMTKTHYISFVAFVTGERIHIIKQYPEWNLTVRIPKGGHEMLIWFCTKHGLFYQIL